MYAESQRKVIIEKIFHRKRNRATALAAGEPGPASRGAAGTAGAELEASPRRRRVAEGLWPEVLRGRVRRLEVVPALDEVRRAGLLYQQHLFPIKESAFSVTENARRRK